MKFEERLNQRIGRDPGFRVPEGYFVDVELRVLAQLPKREAVAKKPELSVWRRVLPYLSLAAMFLGIWCMMKIFHTMSTEPQMSLDNPPATVAAVMEDYVEMNEPLPSLTVNDISLIDDASSEYSSIEEFEKDFGYQLKPEYASMRI